MSVVVRRYIYRYPHNNYYFLIWKYLFFSLSFFLACDCMLCTFTLKMFIKLLLRLSFNFVYIPNQNKMKKVTIIIIIIIIITIIIPKLKLFS